MRICTLRGTISLIVSGQMIFKSFSNSRHNSGVGNIERQEEPDGIVCEMFLVKENEPEDVVDDLDLGVGNVHR